MSIQKNGKLLDDVRQVLRVNHYSIHTEKIYCDWIAQFIKFHKMLDRSELNINPEEKVEQFLTYLAVDRKVRFYTKSGYERFSFFIQTGA
ncbi:hypothetical protein AU255_18405 [Methyloprofundus sedimenti]|uniref:Integrase SAM-like N-terminal domain-containing protein n=1 Tax=Methyloprofundus sedimenti TaxID=1420851 RepID=A0A1V8M1K1_9GAMM|nr:phage integrase N-terminal SAM-like domain-containing protein [Methyloprofundus sedimenti]OQK15441.1 hypothetical protein AU255_18405 [Methyloprofundus sedimenti]